MKLLFNLETIEGNKVKASRGDHLKSLSTEQQITEVEEFLLCAEDAAINDADPKARTEDEIGIVTAKEFINAVQNVAA